MNIREQLPCASRRGRGKRTSLKYSRVFFTLVVKNPPGSGRSPGGGHHYPLQYSCLENSLDRGGWWATAHGAAKSWTILSDCTHTHPSGEESSVQSLSRVRLFVIPWTAARQASLSITNSQSSNSCPSTRASSAKVLAWPNWARRRETDNSSLLYPPMWEKRNTQPTPAMLFHLRWEEKTQKNLWSSQSRGTGSPKGWDLIIGLQNASLPPTTYHHIIKVLFTAIPFTWYIMSFYQEKKITKHAKRQKHNLKFKSIRTRYSRMLEFSDQEFKTAMVNILKALIKQIKWAICAYRGFPGGTGDREPAC